MGIGWSSGFRGCAGTPLLGTDRMESLPGGARASKSTRSSCTLPMVRFLHRVYSVFTLCEHDVPRPSRISQAQAHELSQIDQVLRNPGGLTSCSPFVLLPLKGAEMACTIVVIPCANFFSIDRGFPEDARRFHKRYRVRVRLAFEESGENIILWRPLITASAPFPRM
jgi:hypothetical protein